MSKRKTEPEVIVFEEPKFKKGKVTTRERDVCRFELNDPMPQSADVSELFKDKPEGSKRMSQNKEKEVLDFKATLLEVQKYAVSNLTGKSRRRREEEQILALGGKPGKREKMPYPLYQKRIKAQRKKEKQERRELFLSGMLVPKKKERSEKKGRGRWRENAKSLRPHIGTFNSHGLSLSEKDIARVQRSEAGKRKH